MFKYINCKLSKTNICFVSVKVFIVLTTFVPLFTINWYNNNYNNNCLSDTRIHYSANNCNCFVRTPHVTCHKTAWITIQSCPFCQPLLYTDAFSLQNVLNVEGSWSRLLENFIAKAFVCAFSFLSALHVCCYWFMWKVFDVFVYTLTLVDVVAGLPAIFWRHVSGLVYLHNRLVIVVVIAFVYCT